jgi:hypothetical protein
MGLTKKQRKILEKLMGADAKTTAGDLGVSLHAIYVSNTLVYQNFIEALDAMIEFYPVFERRFKHDEEAYSKLRKLARLIKKEG